MNDNDLICGIAGIGIYVPEGRETAEELARKAGLSVDEVVALGLESKAIPAQEDQPVPMAIKAALQAFEDSGIKPEDIDLVLWTGEEYKDYIAQTASIRLQEETGCHNAWAFDLVGQGITSILGLKIARDMMFSDSSLNNILLAGGTRNIDLVDYSNPDTRFLLPLSASGGAVIVSRNCHVNRLLGISIVVDPEMADEVYVPGGGTEMPFSLDNLNSQEMFYQTPNPAKVAAYLANRFSQKLADTIMDIAGDIKLDYLALPHLINTNRSKVLDDLGLQTDQSSPLIGWGCHGTNDPILSLTLGLESGAVGDGSMVALSAARIGFCYAAAAVKWGES